jgi:hypothetical protein
VEGLMTKAKRAKNQRSQKGQMRVVEAVMASLIVVSAVSFLYVFAATPSSQPQETSELEKIGHNVLHDIDEQRLLTRFVYNSEWANLTSGLFVSLPTNVYFNLSIYDVNGNPISHPLILYGNEQIFDSSKAVASVTYIVPGYLASYNPRILVLKLVRG